MIMIMTNFLGDNRRGPRGATGGGVEPNRRLDVTDEVDGVGHPRLERNLAGPGPIGRRRRRRLRWWSVGCGENRVQESGGESGDVEMVMGLGSEGLEGLRGLVDLVA